MPDDVAVVGYDNTDLCLALEPTLTTVDYRAADVGRCLAAELLALIAGKTKAVGKVIRPYLVERESHEWVKGPRPSNPPASMPVPVGRARRLSAAS